MTLTSSQKDGCKSSVTIKVKKEDREYDVKFYIFENVDERQINLDHSVPHEVDAVHLIPLEDLLHKKRITVKDRKNLNSLESLIVPYQTKTIIWKYYNEKRVFCPKFNKNRRFG